MEDEPSPGLGRSKGGVDSCSHGPRLFSDRLLGIRVLPALDLQRVKGDQVEMRVALKMDDFLFLYEVGEGPRKVFTKRRFFLPFTSLDLRKSSPASLINAAMDALVKLYLILKALQCA